MDRRGVMEGTIAASVIEVIRTVSVVGKGTPEDPVREIAQYWTNKGRLIAEEPAENIRRYSQDFEPF